MPNKHAAIKDLRKNHRRAAANSRIKTNVKSLFRKGLALAKDGSADAKETARLFQQAVDKATKRGIIARNNAGHKKAAILRAIKKV